MNEPAVFECNSKTIPGTAWHQSCQKPHSEIHNLYGLLMAKSTYEGLQYDINPNVRNFVLSRSGNVGIQRYAFNWTGDNDSSWYDLKAVIPTVLTVSLSGNAGTGCDIGGFELVCTPELFGRWIQLGVWLPLCRTHTSKHRVTKDNVDQEPWTYGDNIEKVSRHSIKTRYRMLPYWYHCFYKACTEGGPIMRPVWMNFSKDLKCFDKEVEETQFCLGEHLLIAPILEEGKNTRIVYLPKIQEKGKANLWWRLDTKEKYEGGKEVEVESYIDGRGVADKGGCPVFVKDGSVLMTYDERDIGRNTADLWGKKQMKMQVFGERDSECEGEVYVDQGEGNKWKEGEFGLWKVKGNSERQLITGKKEWGF